MYNLFLETGDEQDDVKWDFNEKVLDVVWSDNYPYYLRSKKNIDILVQIREFATILANQLYHTFDTIPIGLQDGAKLYIFMHGEIPYSEFPELPDIFEKRWNHTGHTSRVLYGEFPASNNTFNGLNKPRDRYADILAPPIGKDQNIRARWRHVFFKIPNGLKNIHDNKQFIDLVIHELAHTAANHVRWRPNDHHKDFKDYENMLKRAYSQILKNGA